MDMKQVKGFRGEKRIWLAIGDETREFVVLEHCLEQMKGRSLQINESRLCEVLRDSYVIDNRPRHINTLLRNGCKKAVYLYHVSSNAIFVLEEDTVSRQFRILKTAYPANVSDWFYEWRGSNNVGDCKLFPQYFDSVRKLDV
jgi:hypothetical protein